MQLLKSYLLFSKKQNQLSVLDLNIRPIAKNKNILEECLHELNCCPDILAVSETKLNKNNVNLASIANYSIVYSNSSSNAGGVAIYILNNLKFTRREDLEFNSNDSENVFVKITLHSKKVIIFGLIYRHPRNSFSEFRDKFLQTIIKLEQDKLDYLICGDFNIDLLQREVKPKISDYINTILSEGCSNIINKPTRITECSASLIDHMYTNVTDKISNRGILTFDISDHMPIFCTLATNATKQFEKKIIRDMRNFNKNSFLDDVELLSSKINNFLLSNEDADIEKIVNNFVNDFSKIVNQHASLRPQSRKERKLNSKPWINNKILKLIRTTNSMFRKCYKKNDSHLIEKYKKCAMN